MEKYYEGVREITDLKDLINQSAELFADRPAFRFKKRMYKKGEEIEFYTISYKEFKKEIDNFGTALNSLGLQDEKIALLSKNRYEWNTVYYAVTAGNKTIVPLDKALPDNEIISLAGRSEAKAIVFEEKYLEVIRKIRDEKLSNIEYYICFDFEENSEDGILSYRKLVEKGKELIENGDRSHLDAKVDSEKATILLFTSGTTATSKAVMLSQKNVCSNVTDLNKVMRFYSTDSTLALLPFHHTFQATINNVLFYVGASLSFCDGLKYIQQNLCEYKPTVIVSVPLILENIHKKIVKNIEKQGKTKLVNTMKKLTNGLEKVNINIKRKVFKEVHEAIGGNVRLIVYGAASMDKALIKSFDGFGIKSVQGFGLTETSPVICVENDRNRRAGSCGKPLPSQEVKIDNPDEQGIGEILSRGPNVMIGYYKNNEATEEVLSGGWFHTGDLGYIDKDGFVFVTGRKKNVIVQKNGKNIFPEEMETLISYIAGVKECMVYGKPTHDNDLDIAVKIVYNPEEIKNIRGFVKEDDVYAYMKEKIAEINKNMPSYKHIRHIIVTDEELIKTTTAKVKRHEEMAKILGNQD